MRCKGAYLLSSVPLKRCDTCSGLLGKGHTPPTTGRTFPKSFHSYINRSEIDRVLPITVCPTKSLFRGFDQEHITALSSYRPVYQKRELPSVSFMFLSLVSYESCSFPSFEGGGRERNLIFFLQMSLPKVTQQRPLLLQAFLKAHFHELLFTALSKQIFFPA